MSIQLPQTCPRGLSDCRPLSQVVSDDGSSYICCGCSDPSTRSVQSDDVRHCWKNDAVDSMTDFDRRDVIDTISVLSGALSVIANTENSAKSDAPEEHF